VVDGDRILYIIANARKMNNRLRGGVVGTLMTNLGLEQVLGQAGIPFARAAVGDRYVMNLMQQNSWEIGGETSGHVICLDKSTTGDAIIAALEVLAAVVTTGKRLSELKDGMPVYPQTMINVRMPRRFNVSDSPVVTQAVKAAEVELGARGRIVLRASGTEPVVRVMVEGDDPTLVERITRDLADVVKRAAEQAA